MVINHNIWVRFLCKTAYMEISGKRERKTPKALILLAFGVFSRQKNFLINIEKMLAFIRNMCYYTQACYIIM